MVVINFLWNMLKILCLIVGIMILISIMLDLLTAPFKKQKEEQAKKEFADALNKIAKECIEELEKDEKTKRKYTKRTNNSKEN